MQDVQAMSKARKLRSSQLAGRFRKKGEPDSYDHRLQSRGD
jgi:hypothetical protein